MNGGVKRSSIGKKGLLRSLISIFILSMMLSVTFAITNIGIGGNIGTSTDSQDPFIINVMKSNSSYFRANYSIDCANVTAPSTTSWINFTNVNGFQFVGIKSNGSNVTSDYLYNSQTQTWYRNYGVQSCSSWYDTEVYFNVNNEPLRFTSKWGNQTSTVSIEEANEIRISNGFVDFNISSRGGIKRFTNSSGFNYIDPFGGGSGGQLSIGFTAYSGNVIWCGLNSGSCSGVETNNPLTFVLADTPVLGRVYLNSSGTYGGDRTNRTFYVWSGSPWVDIIDNYDLGVGHYTIEFLNLTSGTDVYKVSSSGLTTFPVSGSHQYTNLTNQWAYYSDVDTGANMFEIWKVFDAVGDISSQKWTIANSPPLTAGIDQNGAISLPAQNRFVRRIGFIYGDATNSAIRMWSVFNSTPAITNGRGSCERLYSGDTFSCNAVGNLLNSSVVANQNATKLHFSIGNISSAISKIFIYNSTIGQPTQNDLWLVLVNESGTWKYVSQSEGITTKGCGINNTAFNSGICNDTGIVNTGSGITLYFAINGAVQNIVVLNDTIATDTQAPLWSENTSEPSAPASYRQGRRYHIKTSWNDGSGVSTVLFEHNFRGTFKNDSSDPTLTIMANDSSSRTFKHGLESPSSITPLSFGTELNASEYINVGFEDGKVINQTVNIGSSGEPTFRFNFTVPLSIISTSLISEIRFTIVYCDNETASLSKEAWIYNWTGNRWKQLLSGNGDTSNCPQTEVKTINITENITDYVNASTGELEIFYNFERSSVFYGASVDFAKLDINAFGSTAFSFGVTDVTVGTYQWRSIANDTLGNVNTTPYFSYVINKASSQPVLFLNGSAFGINVTSGTFLSIFSTNNHRQSSLSILKNGSLLSSCAFSNVCQTNSTFSGTPRQTFNVTAFVIEGQNFTGNFTSQLVSISNIIPTHNTPTLNSTLNKNFTSEDLTCFNSQTFDADNHSVTNIYNWLVSTKSQTVLNMPFEGNPDTSIYTRDYSGFGNNGTVSGAFFNSSGGRVGGSYSFDSIDNYIDNGNSQSLDIRGPLAIEVWTNWKGEGGGASNLQNIITNGHYARSLRITEPDHWNGGRQILAHFLIGGSEKTLYSNTRLLPGRWYHIASVYNSSALNIYINGSLDTSTPASGDLTPTVQNTFIGTEASAYFFNGTIDEVRIYNRSLPGSQIQSNYGGGFGRYNVTKADETTTDDVWQCEVTPNDGFEDGIMKSSNIVTIVHNITFNITDGDTGNGLSNVEFNCDNGLSVSGIGPIHSQGFATGSYSCTFRRPPSGFYNKTVNFVSDGDKIVDVVLSTKFSLTVEENRKLLAIYDCLIEGKCKAFELWNQTNQTVSKIWDKIKRTDQSVVTKEIVVSSIVSNSSNLTLNYSLLVPKKEGFGVVEGLQGYDDFLPIRIKYWFLDQTNTTCFNQGERPTGVENLYCNPLVVQFVGQIQKTMNFTVDLRPNLPNGTYFIVRNVEIDPNEVWIDYGQEMIGKLVVTDSMSAPLVNIRINDFENKKELEEIISSAIKEFGKEPTGLSVGSGASIFIAIILFVVVFILWNKTKRKK